MEYTNKFKSKFGVEVELKVTTGEDSSAEAAKEVLEFLEQSEHAFYQEIVDRLNGAHTNCDASVQMDYCVDYPEVEKLAWELYKICVEKGLTHAAYDYLVLKLDTYKNNINRIDKDIVSRRKLRLFQ